MFRDFDIQASPKCLEYFSWDKLREIANEIVDETPDLEWYPNRWWHPKTPEDREGCPEKLKIIMIEHKGRFIKILPYVDDDGIKVMSFDPNRELHGLQEGHHRMRGKLK